MTPAVVVIAYNRPEALRRLLSSLGAAQYQHGVEVPLVISIDRGDAGLSAPVVDLAQSFEWRFGPKAVIEQPQRLGLVRHFRECGRLAQRYAGAVLLEDDLAVAPTYYEFASQALACYAQDERVAGVCLYGLWFNGFTHEPFQPLEDGFSAFFLGLPYTQGLAFTAEQWQRFDAWWGEGNGPTVHPELHPSFLRFGAEEWFPSLAAYTATNRRYFCFPRVSQTVAWGDAGSHFETATSWLQTPIQLRSAGFRLTSLDESLAVYDSFFELLPQRLREIAPQLPARDFDVDLNATKQPANLHHDHVLTTRPVRKALLQFGLRIMPPELNLALAVVGEEISLAHRDDVYWDAWAGLEAGRRVHAAAWSRYRPSGRRAAGFAAARIVQTLRNKWPRRLQN